MRTPIPPPPGPTTATAHTYKARGVVVPGGLGISESLQHRVCLDDLILQGPLPQTETPGGVACGLLPGDSGLSSDSVLCARNQKRKRFGRLGHWGWKGPRRIPSIMQGDSHCMMTDDSPPAASDVGGAPD